MQFKLFLVLSIAFWCQDSWAADNVRQCNSYQQGIVSYKQKNYRQAAEFFEKQLQITPADASCLYYCALSHQLSHNKARARQLYEYIISHFTGSSVAQMSSCALNQLSRLDTRQSGSDWNASSNSQTQLSNRGDLSSVPDEVRVPFERKGGHVFVSVQINGRSLDMILDTGAQITVLGRNHLEETGLLRGEGKEQFEVTGVGERTGVKAYNDYFDLKLGPIYRPHFPVAVQDYLPTEPLLGHTFLKDFDVTVDDVSGSVVLRKKMSTAARDAQKNRTKSIAVPFTLTRGGSLIVQALVNGKPYPMIFDTGAGATVFSRGDMKKLGIEIPSDARVGVSSGVAGDIRTWYFNIDSLKVGALVVNNMPVAVTDTADEQALLGQSFFGHLKYAIDNAHNVIYFSQE